MNKLAPIAAVLCGLLFNLNAHAAGEQDVQNSFNPYNKGFPQFPGLKPGLVINKANLEQFKAVLDPGLQYVIENEWHQIKVEIGRAHV